MYGILTNLEYDKHWIFKNYYYSLVNVYGEDNVTRVENINDLNNIKVLFIGDEHFMPNKYIWMNDNFIDKCNELKIRVFIFNNEKIFNSMFPWNEDIQKNVNKFARAIVNSDFKNFQKFYIVITIQNEISLNCLRRLKSPKISKHFI